jgi:hypothetical protein
MAGVSTDSLQRLVSTFRRAGGFAVGGIDFDLHDVEKLTLPETAATREAEQVCRDASSISLANHCFRSYAWGAVLGIAEGVTFDAELFYVAALLHDIGLTTDFDRGGCFESDGARAAEELLGRIGWPAARANVVGRAIYLHMHDVEDDDPPEALLLAYGTSVDVSGRRFDEIGEQTRRVVLDRFPRVGFKRHFFDLFSDQAARKPGCSVSTYMRSGFGERILNAPFDD